MRITLKEIGATVCAALAVGAYAATHESWNVWLIGGSHRWATGAILILGMLTLALGVETSEAAVRTITVLAVVAAVLAIVAFVRTSLTALSLLVGTIVLIWAASLVGHAYGHGHPLAT